MPREIDVAAVSPERFRSVLDADRFRAFENTSTRARELLGGRAIWNVNSTATGGGVAELLRPLVGYARGVDIDARWLVIDGAGDFFTVTKRIHNRLHGEPGDGGPLDEQARSIYERVLARNVEWFLPRLRKGDVVIVHDPQPAGMVGALRAAGAVVIWRCHVGLDNPNPVARETWGFLAPYLREAQRYVFSRESFAWEGLERDRIAVIAPSIDAFAAKNEELDPDTVRAFLLAGGLAIDEAGRATQRRAGARAAVGRPAHVVQDAPLRLDAPVVLQVSRWDALKDPLGVIRGFAEHVPRDTAAHLLYAGPDVEAVADDPEGLRLLREAVALREGLPPETRARVHLASLPMDDPQQNARLVNALQRHAQVIVQKSIAEGFGLTVAEAMWKARPVVASAIGGIQDQIVDGVSGLLLEDARDLGRFGAAVTRLLRDRALAERIGSAAHERVRDRFLSPRSLLDYLEVIRPLL
jgi:trehalose synthase